MYRAQLLQLLLVPGRCVLRAALVLVNLLTSHILCSPS